MSQKSVIFRQNTPLAIRQSYSNYDKLHVKYADSIKYPHSQFIGNFPQISIFPLRENAGFLRREEEAVAGHSFATAVKARVLP